MLGLTAGILVILTVVTWRVARNTLFPAVLFNGIWALTLLCICFVGSPYFSISEYACLIYLTGAGAFSLGSLIVLCAFRHKDPIVRPTNVSARSTRIALDVLLILLVVLFPYYVKVALQVAGTSNILQAIPAIRLRTVEESNVNLFGIAGNLNVLSILVAEAIVLEADGSWPRRLRSILAIVLTLAYGVLTGSKFGALFLLTVFFVSQVKARRLKLSNALAVVALALAFFGVGIVVVNLPGRNFQSPGTVVSTVGKIVGAYWLGSPIAFSRIADRPDSLVSSASIDRVFLETGSKLGFAVEVPSINNATYVPISSDGETTNAFTIYFSYFKDYGWGDVVLLAGLAAIVTLLWRRAMAGGAVAILIYASMCTAILQSIEAEVFFVELEGYLKAVAVFWMLYHLLPRFIAPLWAVGRGGHREYARPV